jgi:hypothetical protein
VAKLVGGVEHFYPCATHMCQQHARLSVNCPHDRSIVISIVFRTVVGSVARPESPFQRACNRKSSTDASISERFVYSPLYRYLRAGTTVWYLFLHEMVVVDLRIGGGVSIANDTERASANSGA